VRTVVGESGEGGSHLSRHGAHSSGQVKSSEVRSLVI
jgi:hypothetical protein